MSRRLRLGLIVTVLVIVAVIATFWALVLVHQHYAFRKANPCTKSHFRRP